MFSGRGLSDELITRPEESYRLWGVVVRDLENLVNEEAIARAGLPGQKKKISASPKNHQPAIRCNFYIF